MMMISKKNRINFFVLIILFAVIVLSFCYVVFRNVNFNRKERVDSFSSPESGNSISIFFTDRTGRPSLWVAKLNAADSEKYGSDCFYGYTYDAEIQNDSSFEVENWTMQIDIERNCFLATAWCGEVEIRQKYQHGTLFQKIDLRNIDKKALVLDYIECDDLILFPLKKGDSITYYPSTEEKEYPINGIGKDGYKASVKIGFNIFSDESFTVDDIKKGTIKYHLKRRIAQDPAFFILVFMSLSWFGFLGFFLLAEVRINEMEQLEQRDKKMIQEIMETFSGFVDAKDPYTGGHSIRVGKYSKMIAKEMNLDRKQCQLAFYCGLLHDCGKIGIRDEILSKPQRLSDDEFDVIKSHTSRGFEILSGLTSIPEACMVARYHHERYDGKGYPDGLKGETIPIYARITCIADAFDAMNSNRCYRRHMTPELILKQITENSGKQFDPDVVDAIIRLIMRGDITFPE